MINTASFVGKMGAATPQLACEYTRPVRRNLPNETLTRARRRRLVDTTSKGAVLAMTRELAMIHAREGIRFNSLCP